MKLLLLVILFFLGKSIFAENWQKRMLDNGFEYENLDKDTETQKISVILDSNSQIQRVTLHHGDNINAINMDAYRAQNDTVRSFMWDLKMMLLEAQIEDTLIDEILNPTDVAAEKTTAAAQSAPSLESKRGFPPFGGSGSATH